MSYQGKLCFEYKKGEGKKTWNKLTLEVEILLFVNMCCVFNLYYLSCIADALPDSSTKLRSSSSFLKFYIDV